MIFFRAARIGEWSRAHQSWLQSAEAPPNSAKSARGSRAAMSHSNSPDKSATPRPRSPSPLDKPLWPRSLSKGFAAVDAKELGGRRSPSSPGGASSLEDIPTSRSKSPVKRPPPPSPSAVQPTPSSSPSLSRQSSSPSLSRRSTSPTKKSSAREAFVVVHAQELDGPSCWRLPGHKPDSAAACLAEAARDAARQLPSSSIMVPPQGKETATPPQGKVTATPPQGKVIATPRQGKVIATPPQGKVIATPRRSVPLAAPEVPSVHGHGRHGPTVAQRKLVPQAVALLTDEEPCALFYDLDQLRTTLGSISAAFPPSATHVPECSNRFL